MNRRITRLGALGIAALCVALPASQAGAAESLPTVRKASFNITVEGVQRTTWTYNHVSTGGCDSNATGSGSEVVRFSSAKARVYALDVTGLSAPVLRGPRTYLPPKLKLRGTVARKGLMNVTPSDAGCGGGVPTSQAKDCGTRAFRGVTVGLDYRLDRKAKDQLQLTPDAATDPFKNCPSGGYSFPTLITSKHNGPLNLGMPRDELFSRKYGKFILIAPGVEESTSGESIYRTSTRWVVTIERLGRKPVQR